MLELCRCGITRWEVLAYLVVFLYYVGENMIISTALPLLGYSACRHDFPNASVQTCQNMNQHPDLASRLQKTSALYYMIEKIVSFVPPLLLSAFFGPWSDRHGRKLPFLLPYFGNMAAAVFFLVAHFRHSVSPIALVMSGFAVRSLSGHFILVHLISFSYIADLVRCSGSSVEIDLDTNRRRMAGDRRHDRNRGVPVEVAGDTEGSMDQNEFLASMCRLQVAESFGMVIGSSLGWVMQKASGLVLSLCMGVGVLLVGVLLIILFFKEFHFVSDAEESQGVLKVFLNRLRSVYRCSRMELNPAQMWGCLIIVLLMVSCTEGRDTIVLPFANNEPLSWPNERYSAYMACFSAFQSVFLLLIAPMLRDHTVVVVSLLCSLISGLWMAFSRTTWSLLVAGCLCHMADCIFPAIKAILCKDLKLDHVGVVMSRLSIAEGVGIILGPMLTVKVFISTCQYFPGLAFLVSSAFPCGILLVGVLVESFCPIQEQSRLKEFQVPEPEGSHVSPKPDFTRSLNVPSVTVSGYGFLWCSSEW